jgi:environmental stress-induced protein Ves
MRLTHLTPADYRRMPWKNGGGTTTELMVEPAGAAADYDWRLSIAEVAKSGPFSEFKGYDRTTMLVEGSGFTLEFPQQPAQRFSRTFEPFRFSGERPCDCTLIDGPVRDFNLIARRGLTAILDVLRLVPGEESVPEAPVTVLHLFHGQIAACGCNLAAGDTLRIDGAVGRPRITATRPSVLAVVRIGG